MADRYVWSGGGNVSPYDTWTNAATTLTTAITGAAAGDDFWLASDHSESTAAAITLAFPGTSAAPNRVISVNRAGSTPPASADILSGATVTTTGSSNISVTGNAYLYGITFNTATGTGNNNLNLCNGAGLQIYEKCLFKLVTTGGTARIVPSGHAGSMVYWYDCTVQFAATGQGLGSSLGKWEWRNSSSVAAITGATIPTTFSNETASAPGKHIWVGLDLSPIGSGKTIITGSKIASTSLINCRLNSAVTKTGVPSNIHSGGVDLIGCHSGSTLRSDERYRFQGTLTTETTIVRTSGASDSVTPFSWKVVTTANNKRWFPFETFDGRIWNNTVGSSKTLRVHILTDNLTLTDSDIWLDVDYLGTSSYPMSYTANDSSTNVLSAGSSQTSDSSEAWTTTGLTTPVKQKLEVTFTPQMIGPIRWRVKIADPSITVYVCPKAELI